jgi:MFS superfamily sulfate permease-like transporter
LASNAPLLSGIITGIVGGIVVSRLSGSQLMVSGPAAGLTAIVATAIAELGSFPAFLLATVLAGVLQLVLYALRAGIIAHFVPSSVLKGMLAAIGLILILSQAPYLLGAGFGSLDEGGRLASIAAALGNMQPGPVLISAVSLMVLVLWDRPALARAKALVPAPLLVVALGVVSAILFEGSALAVPAGALVNLPNGEALRSAVALPDWSQWRNPAIYATALTIALVASLESLLSLEATDKLDPRKRTSSANRELMAQGVGNVLAGSLGGLPMTGVIVRSAVNIDAGARTWRSAFVHGLLLAVAVVALTGLLNRIPLAALATILVYTGYKLAHPSLMRRALAIGPKHAVPFGVTIVAILLTDLLVGIGIGLAVGAFFVLLESYNHAYVYERSESADHEQVTLRLAEEVSFLNKVRINRVLHEMPAGATVTVDGTRSRYIDPDVVELLHEFRTRASIKNITLRLRGIPEPRALHAHT